MSALIDITDASFDAQVIKSDLIVIAVFWAEWSPPSRKIQPSLEELAAEYSSQIKVVKLDIDQTPNAASTYGVLNVPTMIMFKNGQAIERLEGIQPKSEIEAMFKPYLVIDRFA